MISWKIAVTLLLALIGFGKGNIYANTFAVVETTDDYVLCVDFNGNKWAFDNVDGDWIEGDYVSCILYDNGTEIIYDDEILTAKYSGWVDSKWGYDIESQEPIVIFEE